LLLQQASQLASSANAGTARVITVTAQSADASKMVRMPASLSEKLFSLRVESLSGGEMRLPPDAAIFVGDVIVRKSFAALPRATR
jgi:hypothetical protein